MPKKFLGAGREDITKKQVTLYVYQKNIIMNKRFSLALVLCSIFTTLFAQNYHDAAAFDAYGHVKWILTDVGMYYFGEDGRLDKSKSTALADYEKYQIERNASGYISKITTDFETQTFTYTTDHRLAKIMVRGASNYSVSYERDDDQGYQTETTKVLSGQQENTSVRYFCHKDAENWVCKTVNTGGNYKTEKRVVGYWFDQTDYTIAPAQSISLMEMLDNPAMLPVDIFKYKSNEVKKMLKEKGYKTSTFQGFVQIEDFACTYHNLKVEPYMVCLTGKTPPHMSYFRIVARAGQTCTPHAMTLLVEELLAQNIPLKVFAQYPNRHKGYGVMFVYHGYPCRVMVNTDYVNISQIVVEMYKNEHYVRN